MDIFERIVLLKKSPVFSLVRTEDLQVVAQYLEPEEYVKGDSVFSIGDVGNHMYIIRSGIVKISLKTIAASSGKRANGCMVASQASSGVLQKDIKSGARFLSSRYSGR